VRTVTLQYTAAATRSWTVDRDCDLVGSTANTIHLVSSNPSYATSNYTGSASGVLYDVIIFSSPNAVQTSFPQPFAFPLAAGEVVYVASQASGSVTLFLVDKVT
jgi:hypothetical protein